MLILTGVGDRICVIHSCYSENMRQWTSLFPDPTFLRVHFG